MVSQATSNSSDYFDNDPEFLAALNQIELPEDEQGKPSIDHASKPAMKLPLLSQPKLKRPRTPELEKHEHFQQLQQLSSLDENPDKASYMSSNVYGASRFNGLGEYMVRKRAKLQIQNSELDADDLSKKNTIFRGLQIYINGWTEPSVQELRQLIVQYGGIFHAYLDKKSLVTHVLTCALTPAKVRDFKHMKVVRPEWLLESINAGMLLPWQDFIFKPDDRSEAFQGKASTQKSVLNDFVRQSSKRVVTGDRTNDSRFVPDQGSSASYRNAVPLLTLGGDLIGLSSASKLIAGPPTPNTRIKSPKPTTLTRPFQAAASITAEEEIKIPDYASSKSNATAERVMADPAWRAAHTSVAPDFIEVYYRNSRLHHLSTWKAELKTLVADAQECAENGMGPGHIAPTNIAEGGLKDTVVNKVNGENIGGKNWRNDSNKSLSMKDAKLVSEAKEEEDTSNTGESKVIMHCDFDCFFVSAGLVDRPHLRGKPVAVCHSQGTQGGKSSTSEIASASYEARACGIRNGMSLQQARKLCPFITTIPYEFQRYKQLSLQFYTILMSHADDLQAVSVDEALIDVTSSIRRIGLEIAQRQCQSAPSVSPAEQLAEAIRVQVKNATGCEVSIGIAHNILLARLASRRAKPAGSFYLKPEGVPQIMATLDIRDLHGFGHSAHRKAQERFGATSLSELAKKSKAQLCEALGRGTGETLYKAIRGVDESKLDSDKQRKSVSCDINYGIRFESNEQAEAFIHQLAHEIARRLHQIDMRGRSLTLKVMKRDPAAPLEAPKFMGHGICNTFTKQVQLAVPGGRATNDPKTIGEHTWRLLKSFDFDPTELRGIGIQIQKLEKDSDISAVEQGQALLPFSSVASSKKSDKGKEKEVPTDIPEITVQPASQDSDIVEIPNPNAPTTAMDLPRFSQVDISVYDALPEDIRKELDAEYKRRSATSLNLPGPSPRKKSPTAAIESKKPRALIKTTNFKRITQQLAPRSRSSLSPTKSKLFLMPGGSTSFTVSDSELRRLEIDLEVFKMLPPDVQREQIVVARQRKAPGGSGLAFGGERKILRPTRRIQHNRTPGFVYPPPPPPKAKYLDPPTLKQQGKRVIEAWVDGFKERPPNQKDVDFFTKYLVQCVDGTRSTDSGLERAVAIVKWWLILLRRHFMLWEDAVEETIIVPSPGEGITSEVVGKAWWKAFREVKGRMDQVIRKKFGGNLSLR